MLSFDFRSLICNFVALICVIIINPSMKKLMIGLLLCSMVCVPSMARKTAKGSQVYVFGVAQMLTDTVCYMSSVQQLDGASFNKEGLLNDRALYSAMFGQYVAVKYGAEHAMPSLLFSTKERKIKNLYVKMRSKTLAKKNLRLVEVPLTDFQFKARVYDYDK